MSPRSCVKTALPPLLICVLWPGASAFAVDVAVCTDAGNLVISLDEEHAPLHTANFLEYVDRGFYQGTVFHRVISGFMVQGGGFDRSLRQKDTLASIENESKNGLSNVRGSIAAARTNDPHSATAQFFINLVDNARLDGSRNEWGYTVFGMVTSGMQSVDDIAALPTRGAGPFPTDVPDPLVSVLSMSRLDREVLDSLPAEGRAEIILERIASAADDGDMATAMEWIGHYRSTCAPMSSDLLMTEARAAASLSRNARAISALDEYFAIAPETHEAYQEALELYAKLAPGSGRAASTEIGSCVAPPAPGVPDGARAELAEMLEGQARVQAFMNDSTAYLDCLDEVIDDRRIEEEVRQRALDEYNRMVGLTQKLGDDFNQQVRAFRAR